MSIALFGFLGSSRYYRNRSLVIILGMVRMKACIPRAENEAGQGSSPLFVCTMGRKYLRVAIGRFKAMKLPIKVVLRRFIQTKVGDDCDGHVYVSIDVWLAGEMVHSPTRYVRSIFGNYLDIAK